MKKFSLKEFKKVASCLLGTLIVGALGFVTTAIYLDDVKPVVVYADYDGNPELEDGVYFTGDYYGANIMTENSLFNFSANPYLYRNVNGSVNYGFSATVGTASYLYATSADGTQKTYFGLKIEEVTRGYGSMPDNGFYVINFIPEFVYTGYEDNIRAAGVYYGCYVMNGSDVTLDLTSPYVMANNKQAWYSTEWYNQGGAYTSYSLVFPASEFSAAFDSIDDGTKSLNLVFVYNPPDNTSYMGGKNVGIKNLSIVYVKTFQEADTGYLNGYESGYTAGYNAGLAEQSYRGPFASATVRAGILSPLYYPDYHLYTDDITLDNPSPFVITASSSTNSLMDALAEDYTENAPASAPALRDVFGYEFTFPVGVWNTSAFGSIGFGLEYGNSVKIEISDINGNLITTYEGNSADEYYQLNYVNLTQYKDAYVTKITYTAARADLIYNFKVDFSSSYSTGYNAGYSDGYIAGSAEYEKGYDTGYADGYARGAESGSYTLLGPIAAIAGIPATVLTSLFNFEVMGVNILGLVTGFITVAVIAWVVKKFI